MGNIGVRRCVAGRRIAHLRTCHTSLINYNAHDHSPPASRGASLRIFEAHCRLSTLTSAEQADERTLRLLIWHEHSPRWYAGEPVLPSKQFTRKTDTSPWSRPTTALTRSVLGPLLVAYRPHRKQQASKVLGKNEKDIEIWGAPAGFTPYLDGTKHWSMHCTRFRSSWMEARPTMQDWLTLLAVSAGGQTIFQDHTACAATMVTDTPTATGSVRCEYVLSLLAGEG